MSRLWLLSLSFVLLTSLGILGCSSNQEKGGKKKASSGKSEAAIDSWGKFLRRAKSGLNKVEDGWTDSAQVITIEILQDDVKKSESLKHPFVGTVEFTETRESKFGTRYWVYNLKFGYVKGKWKFLSGKEADGFKASSKSNLDNHQEMKIRSLPNRFAKAFGG